MIRGSQEPPLIGSHSPSESYPILTASDGPMRSSQFYFLQRIMSKLMQGREVRGFTAPSQQSKGVDLRIQRLLEQLAASQRLTDALAPACFEDLAAYTGLVFCFFHNRLGRQSSVLLKQLPLIHLFPRFPDGTAVLLSCSCKFLPFLKSPFSCSWGEGQN